MLVFSALAMSGIGTMRSASEGGVLQAAAAQMVCVLLPDGQVRISDLESGATVLQVSLIADTSIEYPGAMSTFAWRGEVFVSVVSERPARTRIIAVRARDGRVRSVAAVNGLVYPYLALGTKTGRLYLTASHEDRGTVLDSQTGEEWLRFSFAHAPPGDWQVYAIGLSPNEDRLYVSFHGGCTFGGGKPFCPHGIDWVTFDQASAKLCVSTVTRTEDSGCIVAHGDFAPFRGGVVAATGSAVVIVNAIGQPQRRIDVRLAPANHFMEFALDTTAGVVYGIGSCLYAGGLTEVSIFRPDTAVDVVQGSDVSVCGNLARLTDDGRYLLVNRDRKPSQPGPGEITVVEPGRRSIIRRIPIPAPAVSVAIP
jgi:hypothetical protein